MNKKHYIYIIYIIIYNIYYNIYIYIIYIYIYICSIIRDNVTYERFRVLDYL